jgi:hypothetical protein
MIVQAAILTAPAPATTNAPGTETVNPVANSGAIR